MSIDCMRFTCAVPSIKQETETNLFRFEVNDSYLAYTSSSGLSTPTKSHMVLTEGVYAVKKQLIVDEPATFKKNTRTEWRVVFVDPFQLKLNITKSKSSPVQSEQINTNTHRITE